MGMFVSSGFCRAVSCGWQGFIRMSKACLITFHKKENPQSAKRRTDLPHYKVIPYTDISDKTTNQQIFGNFDISRNLTQRSDICLYSCNEKRFMSLLFGDIPLVAWRPSRSVWSSTPLQLPAKGTENSCRMKKWRDGKIKRDVEISERYHHITRDWAVWR